MSKNAKTAPDATATDIGGKYLTFFLDQEEYGIEILRVREIIRLLPVTHVPQSPYYVRGVINLRGQVIPVADLRMKFDMPQVEATDETCIIVVQTGGTQLGVIVDKVSEVRNILAEDVVDTPSLGTEVNTEYVMGVGKTEERVILLLDIARVFPAIDVPSAA